MSSPLRGAEIDACVHRIALSRAEPLAAQRTPTSPEIERRRREAERHRRDVIRHVQALHPDAVVSSGHEHSRELIGRGTELILQARFADEPSARRTAAVQGLIRVGRVDDKFTYSPLIVKNHEVIEVAPTRQLAEGSLARLLPSQVVLREGFGLRSTPTVRRDGLVLAGALMILKSSGNADPGARGALVDRNQRLWWLELDSNAHPRFNLNAYDSLYRERLDVMLALDEWFDVGVQFPTSPYWHRECLTCEFSKHCQSELEALDDVSLTRFTNLDQQRVLRDAGVATRSDLAHLDPIKAQRSRLRARNTVTDSVEAALSRDIEKLDDLIYRARAHARSSFLRILEPESMGCTTADVEIDVDMESFNDLTYLWGAFVTSKEAIDGVVDGYHEFGEWRVLDASSEAVVFARFWTWFNGVRRLCHETGRSFAAYCFWAQAEDGAMNRAVLLGPEGGPTSADLDEFRSHSPHEWFDLHDIAKRQIQTDGPLGLKQLAAAAGFSWRDENPSGEASMLWYEVAVRDDSAAAAASRQRILEYNEDDCRATKALRHWLNGPAQELAHRDAPL